MKRVYQIVFIVIFFAAGLFLGWHLSDSFRNRPIETVSAETKMWTCSMHPQIKQDHPGKCPLCGMDLIPIQTVRTENEQVDADVIRLSPEAVALANIQTIRVVRGNPVKEIHLYGTIQPNERFLRSQVSHVNGRIEKLFVLFTGETIREGQTIASVFSPDLLTAQQELLVAVKMQATQPALLKAAREKLRLWKLTDRQIAEIEQSGAASSLIDITANTQGVVIAKKVVQGDYVNSGSILFELADLSSVWALFEAYEADLPYLKKGDPVEYTLQALPGKTFKGKISFIDPFLDKTTRTAKVRVETANPHFELKPEMYASAIIRSSLKQHAAEWIIPKTAILWTGKRSIVYVKQPDSEIPAFKLREIELGPSLGDSYVVLSGIAEGEEIVVNGTFAVDASAQLEGKPSMMNPSENVVPAPADKITELSEIIEKQTVIPVQGSCEMCKERIETTALSVKGVLSASWEEESKQLHLKYDPQKTSPDAVAQTIAQVGHDAGRYKADEKVYEALPPCCHYREK
ncbi:MAG: efflux RND transporter periplasmic adaptor subunit [Candidatus Azobacteroides sp.]|nr:efflux RND transporter periplasmic adaptor subunit [Candidatus Azobacteroides sp.]